MESKMFDAVDQDLKGWVNLADLDAFLKSRYSGSTSSKSERAFRRMDEDNDGKILYEEFLRAVRPVYLYPTYQDLYYVRDVNGSPRRRSASRHLSRSRERLYASERRERERSAMRESQLRLRGILIKPINLY